MGVRLGLYKTIIQQPMLIISKRQIMVRQVAQTKQYKLPEKVLERRLKKILANRRYAVFYQELVRELVNYYPEAILIWLDDSKYYRKNQYFMGLYLALLNEYDSIKAKDRWNLFSKLGLIDTADTDINLLCSNILYHKISSKLRCLNHILTYHSLSSIQLSNSSLGFEINNIIPEKALKGYAVVTGAHKVSIIVTAYNAGYTLRGCVESLLAQTWKNLEIIIVNDASHDDTINIAKMLRSLDSRVKIINLPKNVGTFAAKSIGALYSEGEFLTCQDSDDWAHPNKIAAQVKPLIDNEALVATTSYWFRIDKHGVYYSRHFYPFMRQNPASPMFRLQKVKSEIGLWHIVRTGADSEFFERLKLFYGKDKIKVIKKPLTIASHRENSLMTSEQYGAYNKSSMLNRLDYWEAWRKWHIHCLSNRIPLYMPNLLDQLQQPNDLFLGIPQEIKVSREDLQSSLMSTTNKFFKESE